MRISSTNIPEATVTTSLTTSFPKDSEGVNQKLKCNEEQQMQCNVSQKHQVDSTHLQTRRLGSCHAVTEENRHQRLVTGEPWVPKMGLSPLPAADDGEWECLSGEMEVLGWGMGVFEWSSGDDWEISLSLRRK